MIPDTDLAYAAGVIDSDGCIRVTRSDYRRRVLKDCVNFTYQAEVHVKQVDTEAIEFFNSYWPSYSRITKAYATRGRPLHGWYIHSQAAGRFLEAILPFLRIKRPRAVNALEVCRLSKLGSRRFPVPEIKEGEPMLTVTEVSARLGKSYETVYQAVREGSVPSVRGPRTGSRPSVFIPESYLDVWRTRGSSPPRSPEVNAALEACFLRSKELNRVGLR